MRFLLLRVAATAEIAVTGLAARLTAMLLHTLPDEDVHLEYVQEPAHPQLVDREEIFHPSPEVAQVELVQSWDEESEQQNEIAHDVVGWPRDAGLCSALFLKQKLVLLVGTNLLQEYLPKRISYSVNLE